MHKHVMSSAVSQLALWSQGDWVTKFVALLLLLMSLASWIVILIKALDIVKYKGLSHRTETFWHSESFEAGLRELGPHAGNPFVELAHAG